METHVVAVVITAENAGENVLPGVLLHVVEPTGPVQAAGNGFPGFHGLITNVENDAVFLLDVGDGGIA